MKRKLDCDVIIAGAGPAGAAAAIHLARARMDVVLLDSQLFPRDKVCGDFVSPVALRELGALGLTGMPAYKRSHVIRDAALFLDGEHLVTSAIPRIAGLPAHGRVIPRRSLDENIVAGARAAGAQVREGYRLKSFEICRDEIRVSVHSRNKNRTLRARVLIGADGSNSVVARQLRGNPIPSDDRIVAVRGYFEGIAGPVDRADLYFSSKSFPGYYWLFPTSKTSANVGVGMVLKTLPPNNDHLRTLLLQLIEQDAALKDRLSNAELVGKIAGWPLTTYNAQLPLVGERVLLVGDAAGLINPVNGEGIQYALLSGAWASETVRSCAAQNDFSQIALHAYQARVAKELSYDMALSRTIVQFIRNRSLNRVWLEAIRIIAARARVDPSYAAITGGVLAGLVPARSAVSLEVMQKTLNQAAMSLGFEAVKAVLGGPNHLAQLGVAASQTALDILTTMVQSRDASVHWGVGLATSALGVSGELAGSAESIPRENAAQGNRRRRAPRAVARN